MPRKSRKPPPRVYHDGLIPTAGDNSLSYPEVVPDDHIPTKHEKSYPEVAPPPSPPPTQPTRQRPGAAAAPAAAVGGGGAAAVAGGGHGGSPQELSPEAGVPPPPLPLPLPLPRTSGVHSLRQAWSEVDGSEDARSLDGGRRPLWKRPVFWVAVVALAIIVTLAGILGGVASGSIKTAWDNSNSSTRPSPSSSSPSATNPTCPSANNLNYTTTSSSSSSSSFASTGTQQRTKTFRIQCGVNYPGGDGALGLQKSNGNNSSANPAAIGSLAACLDACAREARCVGAVFDAGAGAGADGDCWLKEFIGVVKTGADVAGMASGVLWQ